MSRDRWKRLLLALVVANVFGGLVFVLVEMLVPSFIVYPLFLIAGSARLVRGRGITGVVFLTITAVVFVVVHLPFTRFGPEGSACPECSSVITWPTLFVLPVALFVAGSAAWLDLRRRSPTAA
ncbi:MAG: hypothetical protein KY396_06675 [Actinobacteria bacterium]|nr:hypothetical protein [Actinomycetota bacterium]